jgi:short-subunit dehydrogenase
VAEGDGLLNRCTALKPYRGFESLRLRFSLVDFQRFAKARVKNLKDLKDFFEILRRTEDATPQCERSFLLQLETMIQLNVVATTRLAGAVSVAFAARGHGTIINIASVLALAPELFNGAYSGTKAYLLNLSQSLHGEIGSKGVRIQAVLPGATRTAIWEKSGTDVSKLPPGILMEVDEMVDAALAGLDLGEIVTIPSLPNVGDWEAFNAARLALGPNLSKDHAADRYKTAVLK